MSAVLDPVFVFPGVGSWFASDYIHVAGLGALPYAAAVRRYRDGWVVTAAEVAS